MFAQFKVKKMYGGFMARRPSVQAQIVDPHREHEPCVSSNTTACNGGGNNVPRNVTRWKQVWGEAWMCRSGVCCWSVVRFVWLCCLDDPIIKICDPW